MTWTEVFGIFTKPLFQMGQTWISLATMAPGIGSKRQVFSFPFPQETSSRRL